jgi:O-antigen/teichoic acid export membrane protein
MSLTRGGTGRAFVGILTGSAAGQLLAIAAVPILARLYDPGAMAHYALLLGTGSVLASVSSLRMNLAIPLPDDRDESYRLFWVAVLAPFAVLPIVGLIAVGLLWWRGWNAGGLTFTDLGAVAAFVIVVCTFGAAGQVAVRLRLYGPLARLPVVQMLSTLGSQAVMGLGNLSRGLFLGALIGRSVGVARLSRACKVNAAQVPTADQVKRLMRRYWRFPVILTPAAAVNVLGANVPVLMLPSTFGLTTAGFYAMAVRVSAIPATVIGDAASQVFLGEFARAAGRVQAIRLFLRWSGALAALGVAVAGAIWLLAPLLLPLMLGNRWEGTVDLAQYTGVAAGAAIIGSPLQSVWTVRERATLQFTWDLTRLATTVAVIASNSSGSISELARHLAVASVALYGLAWVGCLWAVTRSTPTEWQTGTSWS